MELKNEILKYIQQAIPENMGIVNQSVPIVFFGDIENSQIATIGINPSDKEFLDEDKTILQKNKKRVIDRHVLNRLNNEELTIEEAKKVYDSKVDYFKNNPYKRWFGKENTGNMEKILKTFNSEYSYYNDTAVHLDITPWATLKKWIDYKNKDKETIIGLGNDIAIKIIKNSNFKILYVNGASVLEHLEKHMQNYKEHYIASIDKKTYIVTGYINECFVIGSNQYIQHARFTNEEKGKFLKKIEEIQRINRIK